MGWWYVKEREGKVGGKRGGGKWKEGERKGMEEVVEGGKRQLESWYSAARL